MRSLPSHLTVHPSAFSGREEKKVWSIKNSQPLSPPFKRERENSILTSGLIQGKGGGEKGPTSTYVQSANKESFSPSLSLLRSSATFAKFFPSLCAVVFYLVIEGQEDKSERNLALSRRYRPNGEALFLTPSSSSSSLASRSFSRSK